ncbi:putative Cadherin EGF LAG seven-pass G-type receptor 2-like [Homarus americanus]|uniref:Putative Cadherin EGF LAG seven-pass G-type receptor 2-like n=1 Tax=Homarus americanus TaxID=6706 RepID=A0A8J5JQI8_HOMAM|nr:putative Cadherin EGF LAG seven-pass G-type receptor 2-like [Homarus americanus]
MPLSTVFLHYLLALSHCIGSLALSPSTVFPALSHWHCLPGTVFLLAMSSCTVSLDLSLSGTVSLALSSRHCLPGTVSLALSSWHCLPSNVFPAPSHWHCLPGTASTALSSRHVSLALFPGTVSRALSPGSLPSPGTVSLALSSCHCLPSTVSWHRLSLALASWHCLPGTVSLVSSLHQPHWHWLLHCCLPVTVS